MNAIDKLEWQKHQGWEQSWWGTCQNTYEEQIKQEVYTGYMKLNQYAIPGHWFDLKGKSVLDIGGGPCSLLLRCKNFSKGVVVDPCNYPLWVIDRYKLANISYICKPAEDVFFEDKFDECWIYNCLQHTMNPAKIITIVKNSSHKVRVFEYCDIGVCPGHPQNLTKNELDKLFDQKGFIERHEGLVHGNIYYGVFRYE